MRHPVFRAAVGALRPSLVIEVDNWRSGSAIHIAGLMREFGIDAEVARVAALALNALDPGVRETITPLPAPSKGSHMILKFFEAKVELIYIDADHD